MMGSENTNKTDSLWDKLTAKHRDAQREAGNNPNATSVKELKFQKGVSEDVKKLAKYYKFEQFRTTVSKAYTYIDRAYRLYTSYDFEGSPQRMLEALIAGGCNNKKAAEACGLDARTVAAYKKYYFNLEEWSIQQLRLKCQMMLGIMNAEEECRWNWILSCIQNGVDWFIRTHIEMCPTEEDEELSDAYNAQLNRRVIRTVTATRVNPKNVTEQMERQANMVGATHSHTQKDKELNHKLSTTKGSGEDTKDYVPKIHEAIENEGRRPDDIKVSAYDKNIPAEEDIPIALAEDNKK